MSWDRINNEINNLQSYFKKNTNTPLYPRKLDESLLQEIKSENWNKSLAYSFVVVDEAGTKIKDFAEFKLQINANSLTQDEHFAVTITPTQNGIVVEHNGIVLRELVITGTTGINGRRGTGGSTKDGKIIAGDPSARTGYEEFHSLRNYLRAYAAYKKDIKNRGTSLLFINRKDNENLIIEPLKFGMKRSAQKGPLYDYDIQFKILGNKTYIESEVEESKSFFKKLSDVTEKINEYLSVGRAILLRSSDILRQIEREVNNTVLEPLRQMDLLIKSVGGIVTQVGDISDGIISRIDSSLTLKLLTDLSKDETVQQVGISLPVNLQKASEQGGNALLALRKDALLKLNLTPSNLPAELERDFNSEINSVNNLPKSFFVELKNSVIRVSDNAAEAFGFGSETYNKYADRIVSTVPSPLKKATNQELEILYAFGQITKGINLLLAYGNSHFQSELEANFSSAEDEFNNNITLNFPPSVSEVIIPPGATLESLAEQYLNSFERWTEIARLNNLLSPYIDETSTNPRIKKYGDRILIPNSDSPISSNVLINREDKYNKNLTETERRLGIDIRLDDNFDFVINNNKDIEVITGGSNVGQAIKIKFNLEKGDLKYHKQLGLGLIVGEKITSADELYDEIVNTILQDPRFEKINSFDLKIDGNTILVNLNLNVVESATPVPLTMNLQG